MATTIKDIARAIGVSHSTVSRALNGDSRISPETRWKVLRAAEEVGYRPNLSARGLARRQVLSIGLVIPHVSDAFYGRIVHGVDQVSFESGFNLVLYITHADRRREMAALDQIAQRRVDGLILIVRKVEAEAIIRLRHQQVPLVLLMHRIRGAEIDNVRVDNVDGAFKAVTHLVQLGHQRIAFIGGPSDAPDNRERHKGYRLALSEAGMPVDPALTFKGDFTEASGRAAASAMLKLPQGERPTAIFAGNDRMAIGAIEALLAQGIQVPEDVAVVGFDDIVPASYVRPALTTVRQRTDEMGAVSTRLLIDRLRGDVGGCREILLKTELIIRQSCGGATGAADLTSAGRLSPNG